MCALEISFSSCVYDIFSSPNEMDLSLYFSLSRSLFFEASSAYAFYASLYRLKRVLHIVAAAAVVAFVFVFFFSLFFRITPFLFIRRRTAMFLTL